MNLLPDPQREGPAVGRYALAVAATAAAVIVGLLLRPLIHPSVSPPFILAVAVAALYGGIGPGVLASLLSAAALNYWFFPPLQSLSIAASADTARMLVFLIVAAVITWLAGTVRNQRWKEMQAGAVLRANEEALHQVTSRVDVALRGSDIGLWELELPDGTLENGGIIFTNVWEQLGYEHPQASPDFDSGINLSHPDDRERLREFFRAYLAGETPQLEFEHRLRHKNGSYRTMLVRGVAVREPGKLVRVIGSRVDITDRKRSEQALRVSEERFRLASEALAAFLYEWDPTTNHLEWFGGMEEVLGFRLDEVSSDLAWYESHLHPDDLAHAWQSARATLESDARGYTIVYRFRHRDGHYVHVADRSRIVRDEAGRAVRVLGGVSDISERLRLERERAELLERERAARAAAEAATRHRDDVLGVVSHDLRNPLAAISICASAASQSLQPSFASAQHMLASIKHAADSAERLIRDLMDVASIEAGRLAVEPHAEAPASMLEQTADMFAAMASAHGVVLETRTTPDLPAVRADAERVLQGLANLVTNSLRFTEPGGHITLRAEPDPAGVRFAVEDTGSGIASEDLPHVFDRFWQRQHGGGGGSGLGLSIVRGIVDAHGGQVMAESTPGKGSRFSFTLPTAALS